jgi:hypothetical protein
MLFGKKRKKNEPICGNCKLFDASKHQCRVVILHEGNRVNLPVDPQDPCFFEQTYFDPVTGQEESFNEIKQVRFWVEDNEGKPIDGNGTVKMEIPEDFFGDLNITEII